MVVPGGSDAGGFLTFLLPRVLTLHQNSVCLSYEHATRTFQSLLLQTLPLGGVLRLLLTSSFSAGGLRNAATQPVIDKLGSVKTLPAWNLTLTLWEYHKHIHGKGNGGQCEQIPCDCTHTCNPSWGQMVLAGAAPAPPASILCVLLRNLEA